MRQEYTEDAALTIRPPLHTSFSAERFPNSAGLPYFSSLPTTPSEPFSPDRSLGPFDTSTGETRQGRTVTHRDSSGWLSDGRKTKSRAEQNREKMRAYHRRVMQQREAMSNILTEMTMQLNAISPGSGRPRSNSSITQGSQSTSPSASDAVSDSGLPGSSRRSAPEPTTLRNRQKQESKARLRKREIDQVYELGQYAALVNRGLAPSNASYEAAPTGSRYSMPQPSGAVLPETDERMVHTIIRVFQQFRAVWGALVACEQRLASEAHKVSTPGEAYSIHDEKLEESHPTLGCRCIEILVASLQSEERRASFREPMPSTSGDQAYGESSSRSYPSVPSFPGGLETGRTSSAPRYSSSSSYEPMGPAMGQGGSMSGFPDMTAPSDLSASSSQHTDYFGTGQRPYAARLSPRVKAEDSQPGYQQLQGSSPIDYRAGSYMNISPSSSIPYVAVTSPDMYSQQNQPNSRLQSTNTMNTYVGMPHQQPARTTPNYGVQMQQHQRPSVPSDQHAYSKQTFRQHGADPSRHHHH